MLFRWIVLVSVSLIGSFSFADSFDQRLQLAEQREQQSEARKNRTELQKNNNRVLNFVRLFARGHSGLAEEPKCQNRYQKDPSIWAIDETVDQRVCGGGICAIVHGEFSANNPDPFEESIYSCRLALKNNLNCEVSFAGVDWEKFGGLCIDVRGHAKEVFISTKGRMN